ncbi:hypothetical protein BDK51DRAFT_15312, partial [Blyttiomyces helicus]
FQTNTLGPIIATRALLPLLRRGTRKQVVAVSSQLGSIANTQTAGYADYRMSKAALNMALKLLSNELAPESFHVLILHPGHVATDMGGASAPVQVDDSVAGMLDVITSAAKPTTPSGAFMDWRGNALPW